MKGQSLVEFSISLVIILILLSGSVEFGIALFQYIQLRDAAQEGALFGSVCQDEKLIEQRARHASNSPLDMTDENVVGVEIERVNDLGGDGIKVTMTYEHKVFMPFAEIFTDEYISLEAHVTDTVLVEGDCK